ncbi:hypothetical protein ACFPYM_07085, partial [Methylobacterium hispanicum]
MNRILSRLQSSTAASSGSGFPGLNNGPGLPTALRPYTGPYGAGQIAFISATGTWTVPSGCNRIRVRAWGVGGGNNNNNAGIDGGDVQFGTYFTAGGGKAGTTSGP